MTIASGILGLVNKDDAFVGCTQDWTVDFGDDSTEYGASCQDGATGRETTVADWTGNYNALGGIPAINPGDFFKFEGDVAGNAKGYATGANGAYCEGVTIDCDVEGGGILTHNVAFASNGALTPGAVTVAADTGLPPVDLTAIITKAIEIGTLAVSPVYAERLDIRTWQLAITRPGVTYSSSSTAGQTKREAGRLDFEFTYSLYESDVENLIVEGAVRAIKAYISSTLFWDLRWCKFGRTTGVTSDQNEGNIIGMTQVARMDAAATIAGVRTTGAIINPTPTTIWP